ncbi:unnamed protein product [Rotaria sordida]|uniref:Nuclear receptor domain-containing protein n=1 Tax=Rotaria sordida TaxID=392033 RepID=A0A814UGB1_9BILA|nr:unnamed protein product [Rotaria sordida]CAF1429719.1 unnamed protein product [Rotaria sordida]
MANSMDLLHAAECGLLSVVKELLSNNKSIIRSCRHNNHKNHAFNLDSSAIHYACRSGHLNIVKYLLTQDSTIVNDRDRENWTPLHYACYNGHINIVKLLLKYNADVNIKDRYLSQIPIQFAMYRQFEDIVYLLDSNVKWTCDNVDNESKARNIPVFRKKSNLFLGRYILNDNHIKQIQSFRNNLQSDDIELTKVQDAELSNLLVRIIFTHDFRKHLNKTIELSSSEGDDDDDSFLRSSSTSAHEHIMKTFKCYFDNQCQININNRHICTACRLIKCFQCGMNMDLFRFPYSKRKKTITRSKNKKSPLTSTELVPIFKSHKPQMLPTLNILQADISTLTSDQWTLLSNLVHSYDERKVISVCQRLVQEDEYLHSMKPANETLVKQFFTLLYETTELCLSSNGDLRSLSFNDRSVLLRTGADSITCYGGIFSMYQFQLRTCQSFLHSLRRIYGEHSLMLTLNSIKFIDPDIVLNKMALLLLLSSKTTCIFSSTISLDHADVSVISKIQNRYAEIAWKYLLYKYDEYQAVQKFMTLIQCLIAVIQTMSQVQSVESHVNDIETIVEHTQLKLILDDIEQFNETVDD